MYQGCGSSRIFFASVSSFFKVLPLPQKFNCFYRFHIPAPCFMKNASDSGSSKSQMLPSSLPAFFFKVFSLPQKFSLFSFHIPGPHRQSLSQYGHFVDKGRGQFFRDFVRTSFTNVLSA